MENKEARELSRDYLNVFINCIQKGYSVAYVEVSNILAVDHPELGWVGLQLLDKIVDTEEQDGITNGS